jgi:hypothetical protein
MLPKHIGRLLCPMILWFSTNSIAGYRNSESDKSNKIKKSDRPELIKKLLARKKIIEDELREIKIELNRLQTDQK